VWPVLTQLVGRVLAANPGEIEPTICGVTCPGPIDRGTGSMKPVGMPLWHDFPLRRELTAVTGLDVEIVPPGRALALAELWRGEAAGRADLSDDEGLVEAMGGLLHQVLTTARYRGVKK